MTITINGTTGIAGVDGSASTPAVQGTDTNTGIFFPAADTIAFGEGGSEVMRIDSAGRVLIGLTSSVGGTNGAALQVKGLTGSSDFSIALIDGDTTVAGRLHLESTGSNSIALQADPDNLGASTYLGFGVDGTERARIASTGYVYVNTTDTASQDGYISIKATVAGQQCIDSWNSATSGTRTHAKFRDSAGATVRGSITSDGANTAYVTSSDYRLKENIAPLANALSTIVQLKPSVWTWKENQEAGQGFIAHELAEVVPQAVTGDKDAVDADGKPQYQGVDTSFLVATLTAAIQELKAELDTTKARLAALEAK
jgi:hypothetical protein